MAKGLKDLVVVSAAIGTMIFWPEITDRLHYAVERGFNPTYHARKIEQALFSLKDAHLGTSQEGSTEQNEYGMSLDNFTYVKLTTTRPCNDNGCDSPERRMAGFDRLNVQRDADTYTVDLLWSDNMAHIVSEGYQSRNGDNWTLDNGSENGFEKEGHRLLCDAARKAVKLQYTRQ